MSGKSLSPRPQLIDDAVSVIGNDTILLLFLHRTTILLKQLSSSSSSSSSSSVEDHRRVGVRSSSRRRSSFNFDSSRISRRRCLVVIHGSVRGRSRRRRHCIPENKDEVIIASHDCYYNARTNERAEDGHDWFVENGSTISGALIFSSRRRRDDRRRIVFAIFQQHQYQRVISDPIARARQIPPHRDHQILHRARVDANARRQGHVGRGRLRGRIDRVSENIRRPPRRDDVHCDVCQIGIHIR